VKETIDLEMDDEGVVGYFIENSVKLSLSTAGKPLRVEHTIKNGVKQTELSYDGSRKQRTKYVIENGVKDTHHKIHISFYDVEDTIQNGVKDTAPALAKLDTYVEDAIKNGEKLN
jgi:hypothetical protein